MIRQPIDQLRRTPVLRISLPFIYNLATDQEPLKALRAGDNVSAHFATLFVAQVSIDTLLNNSVFAHTLRSCRDNGNTLLSTLAHFIDQGINHDRPLAAHEPIMIQQQFEQFRTALLAELGVLPSYFVVQKGGFDTISLLDSGERLFPNDLFQKVPEAVFDCKQAAMALAYELPTASGFHAFRATESVLRRYYTHETSGQPQPKVRNIGVYIRSMRTQKCGDEIILASIEQLAKLHRNPLIHPEVVLTLEEAISTLGMARSVISAMLTPLPFLPPTTTSP